MERCLASDPPYGTVEPNDAGLRSVGRPIFHCAIDGVSNCRQIFRVDAAKEVLSVSNESRGLDAQHASQIAEPAMPAALDVPVPSHGLAGLQGYVEQGVRRSAFHLPDDLFGDICHRAGNSQYR